MNKVTAVLVRLAVVVAVALGGSLAVQPAAQAATAVSFCFKHPGSNAPYVGTVHLKDWSTGQTIKSGRTGSNGCATFYSVPSTKSVYVKAYQVYGDHNIGQAIYEGNSPLRSLTGTGTVGLGTGYVSLRCTWGLYAYCAGHA